MDDVDDLRIVGTGIAAPGVHLPGQNPGLWARRNLTWNEMAGQNLTIGSYRELTILPIVWKQFEVLSRSMGNYLSWEIGSPELGEFHIYRSFTGLSSWEKIGELKSENEGKHIFSFLDSLAVKSRDHYYQILFENELGEKSFSSVRRAAASLDQPKEFSVWPNPYESGPLHFIIPKDVQEDGWITIYNSTGQVVDHFKGAEAIPEDRIVNLSKGIYLVQWVSASKQFSLRLLKK